MEITTRNGMVALIDDEDAAVLRFKWRVKRNGYVVRSEWRNGKAVDFYLHRDVLGDRPGMVVDHINGDPLDNRRVNLRHVTWAGNARNRSRSRDGSSGFKGVTFDRQSKMWRARIQSVTSGRQHLGLYADARLAARAYDNAAREAYGEFARLNFPELKP
jgi:hypothetical protein